jgi:hypothetical protein
MGGRKKQPFSGPLGSWQVGHWIHVGCSEEDMERSGGEGGALKRAEVARGQVRAGDAVTDASYDH